MINNSRSEPRFDWYQATFEDLDDGRVAPALALALGATVTRTRGQNGYARGEVIERAGQALAHVYSRSDRAGEVHIKTTSESCDETVPLIRRLWPVHRVSRADSSVDFIADYQKVREQALCFARDRKIKHREVSDSDGGATLYLGSTSSENQVRVYKKSEQMRAVHPEKAGAIPDGIVRIELQTRPSKSAGKSVLSGMSASQAWGMSKWTTQFSSEFFTLDAEYVQLQFKRPSDWSRALHYLGEQYGPSIARRLETHDRDLVLDEVLQALGL